MESKTKFLGHAVHPVMVVFPLGLLLTSTAFDAIALATDNDDFAGAAHKMIGAGIVSGTLAAVFGLADWRHIPNGTRAKEVGLLHGVANGMVTGLFVASWLLRREDPKAPGLAALTLSLAGAALAGASGWLGGELTTRLGVGIDIDANLNAPNSLTGLPASGYEEAPDYWADRIINPVR